MHGDWGRGRGGTGHGREQAQGGLSAAQVQNSQSEEVGGQL